MNTKLIITIDGPSGAGKSTASKALAAKLGYDYLDTGAMYRALAYKVHVEQQHNGSYHLQEILKDFEIHFELMNGQVRTFLENKDISEDIREPHISMLASNLSTLKEVRQRLTQLQRILGAKGGVVAEGRDMGTVVFPQAHVKFYLDAEVNERARRRRNELLQKNREIGLNRVLEDMKQRDKQDSLRKLAPLKPAPGAVRIDSTHLSLEEVVCMMADIVQKKYA